MKTKLILDTDIGDDVDDAFALALAMRSPDCELVGVTTAYQDTPTRARIACKLLHLAGRGEVPVAAGRRTGDDCRAQKQWAEGFEAKKPLAQPAAEFIVERCRFAPGQIVLCTIGPLTNLADALEREPNLARYLKGVVMMAGMVENEAGKDSPKAEWNVLCDIPAAKKVFAAGLNPVMVGLDVTLAMRVSQAYLDRMRAADDSLARAVEALRGLWGRDVVTLHNPLALAFAVGHAFFDVEPRCLNVDDAGRTVTREGPPNARVALRPRAEAFLKYYFETVLGGR